MSKSDLDAVILDTEDRLHEEYCGVQSNIRVDEYRELHLGRFSKKHKGWRLFIVDRGTRVLLVDASEYWKRRAIELLPALELHLAGDAAAFSLKCQEAIDHVESVLAEHGWDGGKP